MTMLVSLFLIIAVITLAVMAGIDMFSRKYIESKLKVDQKNEVLQRKYNWCFILYHVTMALGTSLMLITLVGLLVRYVKYIYSLI